MATTFTAAALDSVSKRNKNGVTIFTVIITQVRDSLSEYFSRLF